MSRLQVKWTGRPASAPVFVLDGAPLEDGTRIAVQFGDDPYPPRLYGGRAAPVDSYLVPFRFERSGACVVLTAPNGCVITIAHATFGALNVTRLSP